MTKKSVKQTVKDELKNLGAVGFANDDEFDPNAGGSPFLSRKSDEEILIDRLFASYSPTKGFYLKLEKERMNEWELKETITKYEHWADFQKEITDLVRHRTKLEIERTGKSVAWGSGRYRVTVFNQRGMREDNQAVAMFSVDAQEYMIDPPKFPNGVTPATDVSEILRTINQTQMNPGDVAKQHFEAMKMGMDMAINKDAKAESTNNTMMTAMFGMMGTVLSAALGKPVPGPAGPDPMEMFRNLKDLGVIPDRNAAPPQKSYAEMITELRAMGIKIGNDNDDMATQVTKFKNMIGLFRDITGGGDAPAERPGIAEKLIDAMGPKIPDMVIALSKALGNGNGKQPNVMPRKPVTQIPPRAQQVHSAPEHAEAPGPVAADESQMIEESGIEDQPGSGTLFTEDQHGSSAEDDEMMRKLIMAKYGKEITEFSSQLKEAVTNDRTDIYPYITEVVSKFTDEADFNLKTGVFGAGDIIKYVLMFDKATYADPAMRQKLISYTNRYIEYVRSQGSYYAQCSACHDFAEFAGGKADFEADEGKICGQELESGVCSGTLQAIY